MTLPAVTITELDGALGVLPPNAGALALIGVSSKGPTDEPAAYARVTDLVADFGVGPLVEAAAHYVERYGRPVVVVRTGQTVPGDYGAIDDSGVTGTAEITETAATEPLDDYEVVIEIVNGGTLGTTGITWRYSLDGGRNWSAVQSLATGLAFAIAGTGVSFTGDSTKTLVTGDKWSCVTTAPQWDDTELATALDALKTSALAWELVHVVGAVDPTALDVIDTKVSGMAALGKYRAWVGNIVIPGATESESAYLAAQSAAFASKATVHGMLCAGACKLTSSVTGRKERRPVSFAVAARLASVSEEIDIAAVDLGALTGVSIRDANGNPDEHDEAINPGLDDARFCTLRTWEGVAGVYVTNPRLLSPQGSDFEFMQHRRVLNLAHGALRPYFIRRLSKPVRVDKDTGFILEADAREIEAGARAAMAAKLTAKPKASEIQFALSRTDSLLSTKTMTGTARVKPLAYPKLVELEVGFMNPALAVQTVG